MKKYLVKETSYATENNKNFAGMDSVSYYGKGSKRLAHHGSAAVACYSVSALHLYQIEEYGYDRECDAKRSWIYKNPENTEHWQSTVEVIEFNI